MFYDPRENVRPAPLTHNPINALVAPRPIGWIGSLSVAGKENLAPFSYFNVFSADPPVVAFAPNAKQSDGGPKDTLANVRAVPEFTASIVSEPLVQQMNETSRVLDHGVSEFAQAGLTSAPSSKVRPPHVGEALAVLECVVFDIVALPARQGGRGSHLVIGEVIGIHIDDALIVEGKLQTLGLQQVARLGSFDYTVVRELFEIPRPD
ncbi:MAG: flavin reductase family protein [Gammaproteobacteria bacterium]|nr:flavin reductase family protein [Gammaproteobacteria bacterium]